VFPLHDVNPTHRAPVVTLVLIAANIVAWLLWQPHGDAAREVEFLYRHAAVACEVIRNAPITADDLLVGRCLETAASPEVFPDKQVPLSVLASLFLHGGLLHLAGNMWFLWVFGNNVEDRFGHVLYGALYLSAGVIATLGFVAMRPDDVTPLIGASGAVAGILGAYLLLYPRHAVVAWAGWFVMPVPAALFLAFWFIGQFFVGDVGVAWEAHVAGFLAGMLLTLPIVVSGRARTPARRRRR
jgi:membrane associated rhomboid family serine protease